MKLILYSGGYFHENNRLDAELIRLLGGTQAMITYIPDCFEDSDEDYEDFIDHYSNLGIPYYNIFHADRPHSHRELQNAFAADAIFLSGGNTFYFLKHLKESLVLEHLAHYVRRGGILFGESAGAIMMTPNIATASFPDFDHDENEVGLEDWTSMNLVPFEFFPHYQDGDLAYERELLAQSERRERTIYAVPDGSGIVIDEQKTSFVGDVWGFCRGQKIRIP